MNDRGDADPLRGVWWLALLALAPFAWAVACTLPAIYWNPARLASAYVVADGLPLYATRESAAQLGWFYGPGFALWYLPVTLVRDITALHLVAGLWNALTVALPFALTAWAVGLRQRTLACVALGTVLLAGHGVAAGSWLFLHVDAVCLLCGTVAGVALLRWQQGGSTRWLHAAALALACAVWTKQIAVMLYPALALWLWREQGRAAVARFVVCAVTHAAWVSVLVLWWFGAEEVLFSVLLTHLRNPRDGGWPELGGRIVEFGALLLPWLPLVAALLWWRRRAPVALSGAQRAFLRQLGWVALWLAPVGFSASIMAGGGLNSVHSLHYVLLALLVLAAVQLSAPWPATWRWRAPLVAVLVLAVLVGSAYRHAARYGVVWELDRGQEEMVAQARAQPGRCYFPWNPLITVLTERKLLPTDNALFLLHLMGLSPPADRVRAALPERPIVVYREPVQSRFALRYLPELRPNSSP